MLLKKDFFKLTKKEMQNTVDRLMETSAASYDFYMFFILAIIVTVLGILINNTTIVIGGMLISPILSPTFALGMGVSTNDRKLMKRASSLIVQMLFVGLFLSAIITFFFVPSGINVEMISRIMLNPAVYGIIAAAAGIAGAYSYAKESLSASFPGVAIAVAILPPIVVMGIGLATLNYVTLIGAAIMFFTNFFAIFLVSVLVFSLLGFNDVKRYIGEKVDKEEDLKEDEEAEEVKEDMHKIVKKIEKMTGQIIKENKKKKKIKKK